MNEQEQADQIIAALKSGDLSTLTAKQRKALDMTTEAFAEAVDVLGAVVGQLAKSEIVTDLSIYGEKYVERKYGISLKGES